MIKILILLLPIVLSFKFYGADVPVAASLQACTSGQINSAIAAIAKCDQVDQLNTTKCIAITLNDTGNLNQTWNVWLRSLANTDGLNYWTWNVCNVSFNNYGKYNRNFVLWPARNYTYLQQRTLSTYQPGVTYVRGAKTSNGCTDWQVWNAYYYINYCDSATSTSSSACIYNSMNSKLNQKWNVWVGTVGSDKSALTYWSNGCQVQIDYFGKFTKYYFLWKAE